MGSAANCEFSLDSEADERGDIPVWWTAQPLKKPAHIGFINKITILTV